jgi:hypothetical protein
MDRLVLLPAASSFTLMAVGMQHSFVTQGQQNPVYSQVTKLAVEDLAAVTNGKGASMIGLEDLQTQVIATKLRMVLQRSLLGKPQSLHTFLSKIADPGYRWRNPSDSEWAIARLQFGSVGAETNTLAILLRGSTFEYYV